MDTTTEESKQKAPESSKETTTSAQERLTALQESYRSALISFIVVVLAVVATTLWASTSLHNIQLQSAMSSIAFSIIASLVYSLFYLRFVERPKNKSDNLEQEIMMDSLGAKVTEQVNNRVDTLLNEEATRLVNTWPNLLPADYFPASDEPDKRFRQKLKSAMSEATRYTFRGSTGHYVVRTLKAQNNTDLRCNVLIMDPTNANTLEMYARSRLSANGSNAELTRHVHELRDEIYAAIVAMFEVRRIYHIAVKTTSDPLFYRSEVLDNCAFVSYYTGKNRKINPETYCYTNTTGSAYFEAFSRDARQVWDAAKAGRELKREMTDAELEEFLIELGAGDFNNIKERIKRWKELSETYVEADGKSDIAS